MIHPRVIQRTENAVFNVFPDETVILDVASGEYFSVSGTGAFLWNQLGEPISEGQLEQLLIDQYHLDPAQAKSDITQFIDQLIAASVVRLL